tara:strand:+ start:861 stop:2030 length:1170 start_codon:yes stop_codon:yes gene_type:complete
MSSLLEEAIVDAKALKEAALKNAENIVLEKYSGDVKSALETLLEQDDLGLEPPMEGLGISEDAEEGADPELTEFLEEVPYAFQNEELDGAGPEEIIEIDFDALKTRLEEEDQHVRGSEMIDATELAEEIMNEDGDCDPKIEDCEIYAGSRTAEKASAVGATDGGTPGAPLEEDEDISLTEEMLSDLVEELMSEKVVYDGTPVPQGWSSVNSADNFIEQANNDAMAAAQAVHLEEEEEIEEDVQTASDVVSAAQLYESKISKLKESTREQRALLMESKNQLTKLNLENAKLVYQNKALSSASLNERQKNKIVEAVQSANSVEEANMIFETIQNAVGVSNSRNSSRPQTLREVVQRPTSLLLNAKNKDKNKKAINDPAMGRMLHLAGLTKK